MRFRKGFHYPHPPRGPARRPYHVSEAARRARRSNLSRSRLRSDRETAVIKLLIWQASFDDGPHPTQRALARQLRVWPSYVCKVQKQADAALEALNNGQRVALNDLDDARRFTAKLREQEPGLLAPATRPQRRATSSWDAISERPRIAGHEFPASNDPDAHGRVCPCRICSARAMIDGALKRAAEAASRSQESTKLPR
jgi:hypothetical protein